MVKYIILLGEIYIYTNNRSTHELIDVTSTHQSWRSVDRGSAALRPNQQNFYPFSSIGLCKSAALALYHSQVLDILTEERGRCHLEDRWQQRAHSFRVWEELRSSVEWEWALGTVSIPSKIFCFPCHMRSIIQTRCYKTIQPLTRAPDLSPKRP